MFVPISDDIEKRKKQHARAAVSVVAQEVGLAETIVTDEGTGFCVSAHGEWRTVPFVTVRGERVVPYSAGNTLLRHGVVLLADGADDFESEEVLVSEVKAYLARYVQLTPQFATVAAWYVLLTWRYDTFSELPYLRVRGDAGSGKTRFLVTVGSISYKPIFASGASTVSPLFRILDVVQGTLVLDESDFRMSDEKAELVKVLNNGNARGFPVLRSEQTRHGEYDPRAYHVYGPKLVATRGFFEDRALESRCITEEMGQAPLARRIPISRTGELDHEAKTLRRKLLAYRFLRRGTEKTLQDPALRSLEPRLAQIYAPLLAVVGDHPDREVVLQMARRATQELAADRGFDRDAALVETIAEILGTGEAAPTVARIAERFSARQVAEGDEPATARKVGWLLRHRLRLTPERRRGSFVLPEGERPKLMELMRKYGIEIHEDIEDVDDIVRGSQHLSVPENEARNGAGSPDTGTPDDVPDVLDVIGAA